ncbi:hypothetical protein BEP19_05405 [Ammoniphilus oxalaticus]|uniref:MFS transporter n=1 Tax=Ammoniphilus oxalaticus TaxID=66863 RepID=A0A419SKX6_9BACL|nr:hypothetical protein BEP19_05405 [Ammoniphilus oxalaticus]
MLKQHLGPQGRLLLIVNTLFLLAEALSGTFVNVYLWKEGGGYALIGLYNVAFYLAIQITFMFSGKWVKVHNKMSCLRAGISIAAAFYLLVLFLGDNAIHYILPLGFIQGIGHGFFWLSFNIILFEITSRENRDKYNGLAGVFSSFVGMAAPLGAGYFISKMTGMKGYYVIFSVSLGVYITGAILSSFLHKRKAGGKFSVRQTFSIIQTNKTWRLLFLAMIGQGINESVFTFLVGILVFVATNNEWKVGIYTCITSGVAFISFYAAGKYLLPEWRNKALFWGSILMSISVLPLFYVTNYSTLLWMGIGISLFSPLFLIPAVSIVFDTIGQNNKTAEWKVENIIIRETGLNVGRLLALAVFIILISWNDQPLMLNSILFAVSLAQLITWHYMRQIKIEI